MNIVTASIRAVAVTTSAPVDRPAMIKACETAAEFFQALADAYGAEEELDSTRALAATSTTDWADVIRDYERCNHDALGRAVMALRTMPVKWAALLECELPKPASVAPQAVAV